VNWALLDLFSGGLLQCLALDLKCELGGVFSGEGAVELLFKLFCQRNNAD
jgi:hypothetical protein